MKLRIELLKFAEFQEKVLRDNDNKGGWVGCDTDELIMRLEQEVLELKHVATKYATSKEQVTLECADIANFAMMIADNQRS